MLGFWPFGTTVVTVRTALVRSIALCCALSTCCRHIANQCLRAKTKYMLPCLHVWMEFHRCVWICHTVCGGYVRDIVALIPFSNRLPGQYAPPFSTLTTTTTPYLHTSTHPHTQQTQTRLLLFTPIRKRLATFRGRSRTGTSGCLRRAAAPSGSRRPSSPRWPASRLPSRRPCRFSSSASSSACSSVCLRLFREGLLDILNNG